MREKNVRMEMRKRTTKSGDGDMKNHSNRETRETDSLRDLKSAVIDKCHRDR